MDLRSLINKLDTLDQKQLLKESAEVFEALTGIQYSDVEALAKQYPPGKDTERATALAKMAKDNNLPGLFDPFTNKYVNANTGTFARIGAYDAEVTLLKNKGLLPLGATTSNWGMGQDQASAQAGNLSAQDVIKKAYRADAILDKAVPALANQAQVAPQGAANESITFTSGIASSLLEEFGYNKKLLVEAISKAEHAELKKLVADLTPYAASNHQAGQVISVFKSYNVMRDQLIKRIQKLILRLKNQPGAKKVTSAAPAASQSGEAVVHESVQINLSEGSEDQWLYHSGQRDNTTLSFINSRTKAIYTVGTVMENIDGTQYMLVEADASTKKAEPERGTLQRIDDTVRAVANVWTGGWADNAEAKLNSWVNGTPYGEELKKSLAHTDEASKSTLIRFTDPIFKKEWTPSAYDAGTVIGAITMLPSLGWKATLALMATDEAQQHLARDPHNTAYTSGTKFGDEFDRVIDKTKKAVGLGGKDTKGAGEGGMEEIPAKGFPYDPQIEDIQRQLIQIYGKGAVGTSGKAKDGIDGRLGKDTARALEKARADGYTLGADNKLVKRAVDSTASSSAAVAPDRSVASSSTSAGAVTSDEEVVKLLQSTLGVTPTGKLGDADVAAFTEYVKKNGGDSFEALNKLIGGVNESALSESERMSALKSRLVQLDEESRVGLGFKFLTKLLGKDEAKVAADSVVKGVEAPAVDVAKSVVHKADAADPNVLKNLRASTEQTMGTHTPISAEMKGLEDFFRTGKLAPEVIPVAEKSIAEKFGFKAGQAWASVVKGGGKALTYMKNPKWLTAFLLLAAAGFVAWKVLTPSDKPADTTVVDPRKPVDGKCTPGYELSKDGATCVPIGGGQGGMDAVTQEALNDLNELLQELVDGWPDDADPTLVSAAEVGGKPTSGATASGEAGMAAKKVEPRIDPRSGLDLNRFK